MISEMTMQIIENVSTYSGREPQTLGYKVILGVLFIVQP